MWHPFPWWVWFVAGAAAGSFLNVLISRIPREQNPLVGRSACPHCGKPIAAYDLIPILSWFWLRGRCRRCGSPISIRYLIVEILGGLVAVLIGWRYGASPEAVLAAFAAAAMGTAAFIDLEHLMVSDLFTWFPAVPTVLLWLWIRPSFVREAVLSALGYVAVHLLIARLAAWRLRRRLQKEAALGAAFPEETAKRAGADGGADGAGSSASAPVRPRLHRWGHELTWLALVAAAWVLVPAPYTWLVPLIFLLGILMLRYQRELHERLAYVTLAEYVQEADRTGEEPEALGMGDVCFSAFAGALLGAEAFLALLLLGPLLHFTWYGLVLWRRVEIAPYLPALSLATLLVHLFGEEMLAWLVGLLVP